MLVGDKRAFKAWGKMVKIKSLIILILRTWFIPSPHFLNTQPGASSPRRVSASFSVCIHVVRQQTQLPNCHPSAWSAADVLLVANSTWHWLRCANSLSLDQLVKLDPVLLWAAEHPGSGRFCTPTWSPALPASHLLAGPEFSPGSFRMQQPLPSELNLASFLSCKGRKKKLPCFEGCSSKAKLLTEFRKSLF
jgi:hypothetical protein